MNTRLHLHVLSSENPPVPKQGQIYVDPSPRCANGMPAITATMTHAEVDGIIDNLITELETIRKEAKTKLR